MYLDSRSILILWGECSPNVADLQVHNALNRDALRARRLAVTIGAEIVGNERAHQVELQLRSIFNTRFKW